MIKLYKEHDGELSYAECWINGDVATTHTGVVGDRGEAEEVHDIKDEDAFFADFQRAWAAKGFAPLPKEQQYWVVLQWPMKTITGNAYNRGIRDRAIALLNEHLGWLGLGHVDGFDMGKTGNPQEEFALNILCIVVDVEIAIKSIIATLPLQIDCSRLKIAARPISSDGYLALQYSAKEKDRSFYI